MPTFHNTVPRIERRRSLTRPTKPTMARHALEQIIRVPNAPPLSPTVDERYPAHKVYTGPILSPMPTPAWNEVSCKLAHTRPTFNVKAVSARLLAMPGQISIDEVKAIGSPPLSLVDENGMWYSGTIASVNASANTIMNVNGKDRSRTRRLNRPSEGKPRAIRNWSFPL